MSERSLRGARWLLVAAAVLLAGVLVGAGSDRHDWPQFRGIHRDGISPETGLLASWPEGGPKEVWRVPLGDGYSAISVVGNRAYTMYSAEHDGEMRELAAAFDSKSGKELWRVPVGEHIETQFGDGPRATPTVDGDTLFVLGSFGDFAALSTRDGSARWTLSLTEKFGSERPYWGFSTSALVDGDLVLIEGGGSEGKHHAALDRETGEVKWTLGDGRPGYNSALVVEIAGKRRYVHVAGQKLVAMDAKGNEIWSHEWPQGETHAMPVFVPPDMIFASGVEGVGGRMFRIREKGGSASVEEIWQTDFMRNHFSSSVYHDGHIFGFDNATLKCIDAKTGELAWAKRGLGKGSMILADGRLLVLSDKGKLLMLEATSKGYEERGSVQALEGRCWTAPTLSRGKPYLRNHTEMVAYDLEG